MKKTLEQYLQDMHTAQTAAAYIYEIKKFKIRYPNHKHLRYEDIISYIDFLQHTSRTTSVNNRIIASIKKYYDFLFETGKRHDHPCKNIKIGNKKTKAIQTQNLFTREELMVLLERHNRFTKLEIRNKIIVQFLIYQAMQSREITRISVHDIDFANGTIYIKRGNILTQRTLELHPTQIYVLQQYISDIRPQLLTKNTDKLLIGLRGAVLSVDAIHAIFEQFKQVYPDRKLNPTTIRQSTISYWLNVKKFSLEHVQDLCGHRYPSSTEMYKSIDIESSQKWVNTFHPIQ